MTLSKVFKAGFKLQFEQKYGGSDTDTQTLAISDMHKEEIGANCNCPTNIPSNTFW